MAELFENPPNIEPTAAADVTVVSQQLERGAMFWFAPEEPEANGTIFALMDTGQWWRGEDDWDGVFELDDVSPPGLIMPKSGFGNAWAWMGFKDELGFARTEEYETTGYYKALGDGWELRIGERRLLLPADRQWMPPKPGPEPGPEPGPGLIFESGSGHWVWLEELGMVLNLAHGVWVQKDHVRVGPHDIVLALPEKTATKLLAYVRTLCVKSI